MRTAGPLATGSQGDVQALPGGGWMVGWGGLPNFTEFDAGGQVVYRRPAAPRREQLPRLPPAVERRSRANRRPSPRPPAARTTTVYASWNGATTVASWQLLAGASASSLSVVGAVARSGFETTLTTPAAPFVEVRALSASGKVLATSKALAPAAG